MNEVQLLTAICGGSLGFLVGIGLVRLAMLWHHDRSLLETYRNIADRQEDLLELYYRRIEMLMRERDELRNGVSADA